MISIFSISLFSILLLASSSASIISPSSRSVSFIEEQSCRTTVPCSKDGLVVGKGTYQSFHMTNCGQTPLQLKYEDQVNSTAVFLPSQPCDKYKTVITQILKDGKNVLLNQEVDVTCSPPRKCEIHNSWVVNTGEEGKFALQVEILCASTGHIEFCEYMPGELITKQ